MSEDDLTPVTTFPDDRTAQAWPERKMPAVVTVRCGRGEQRCGRLLEIYETPRGGLVHFFTHTPDRPVHLSGLDKLTEEMRADLTQRYKKVDYETGDALRAREWLDRRLHGGHGREGLRQPAKGRQQRRPGRHRLPG